MVVQFFKTLLRKIPVLTMFAFQIAARTGETEPEMAGNEMVERCLFNGTYVNNGRLTIDKSV
jgi:hypothetical protein